MIYATFDNLHRYLGISANLDTAIRFITTQDLTALHNGRNEIDGDNVFVNVFEFDTVPEESGMWEAHLQYADIHVDITGFEKIGVTDMAYLTETCRKEDEDFVGCEGPVKTWVPITSRTALVVFPEDAHMVKNPERGKHPCPQGRFQGKSLITAKQRRISQEIRRILF